MDERVPFHFPISLYFAILCENEGKVEHLLISKGRFTKQFIAGKLFGEAIYSGTRIIKYMNLYKAYETLMKPKDRNLKFSSTRHSISHTTTQLTRPDVVKTLNDLYDGLEIDLSKFRHKKFFYITLWNLLIETEKLILFSIIEASKEYEFLYPDIKIIK